MRSRLLLLSSLLALTASSANIDEIARSIAASNPQVVYASRAARIETENEKAENVLPDPSVELEHLWGNKGAGNKLTVSLSQEFQWPGLYSARSAASKASENALVWLERSTFLDKALEAKLAILDLIYNRRCLQTLTRMKQNVDSILSLSIQGHKGGELSILDINKLKIEQAMLDSRCNEKGRQIEYLQESINAMAGGKDCTEALSPLFEFPAQPLLSVEDYIEQMRRESPSVNYDMSLAEAATKSLSVVRAEQLPSFALGYIYNLEAGVTFTGFNATVSLPLWSRRHKRQAAIMQREEYTTSAATKLIEAEGEIRGRHASAISLRNDIDRIAPAVNDPRNIEFLKKALDGGEISLINYIQEVNYFLEADLNVHQLMLDYSVAISLLNKFGLLE